MNAQDALKLARRFIELPQEKRRLFLEGLQQQGVDFALFPIPAEVAVEARDGLSYAQQRMWFLWQLDPQSAAYNLPMAVRLNGELNIAALHNAFDGLVARHETLRSQFSEQDGVVRQRIVEPFVVSIVQHDLTAVEAGEQDAQVRKQADAEALAPFDLAQGPLLRVQLLKLAAQEHVLLLTLHHIVADGWSYNVLIEEFIRLYDAACTGSDAALQPLPIQYRDYALWQRSWLEAGEQDRQLDYWRNKLGDDHSPLELPLDHPRPVAPSYRGARHEFQVEPALAERLRGLAREQGVTLFMVLLAAFKVLLHRYSGQQAIRVGVPVANRNRAEVEGLIGCFINTQVLHTEIDPLTDVRELLQRVKETALGAQGHQELPFERLVEAFGLDRSLSISPLFQVMFNHQSQVADAGAIKGQSGLSIAALERETRIAQFDLSLDTYEKGGKLFAAFGYATDLFDSRTVAQMAGHYSNLLQALATQSQARVCDLVVLDDEQRQQIVQGWNATQVDYPLHRGVHQLIEAQAEQTPQAPALTFGSQTLSYAELNARANRLAHYLITQGVQPDGLVGIAVERSLEMVVGLLAILKAGGAYVPLDPEYPTERLAYMLEDSGIRLLLSQSHLDLPLSEGVQRIDLEQQGDWLAGLPDTNPQVLLTAEHLAYVIYTSGSTGKPKGAGNRHSALTNRLCWMQQAYGLDASDSVMQKTPFSFDVSVWEFFWPLMTGARLVVAQPGAHRDPAQLVELINRECISTLHFVPSMLQAFLQDANVGSCGSLKRIVCSGEALPVDAQQQVFAKLPQAGLYNLYGPTEAAIDVTHWTCVDEGRDAVPIGLPIANLGCHVLDANLEPVPVGVLGELYLFGEGLARGYHQRPALTGERFVASPFADGARMYRTGDLARYREDGVIEYAGRIDHQVKLRGLRIELGEIEARLLEHDVVRETAVLAVDGKHLVGYVVLTEQVDGWRELLAAHLAQSLPDYMVPAQWIDLAQMPLSPNGKLDRKALPRPDAGTAQTEYAAPQNQLEQRIAEIWQDVLKREQIGRNDNFFELGGDSIVSIQVVSRARQAGIQFTPKDLFLHQTVRSLAAVAETGAAARLIDQGAAVGDVQLTPVQHWFFDLPMSERQHWNQSLLLDAHQPVVAELLEQVLQAVVQHHDALRLRYAPEGDNWRQWYADVGTEQSLLWHGPDNEAFYDEVQRSLNLAEGPLLRAALMERPEGGQRLLLAIHHLVVDGVSWRILLEDLQSTYQRLAVGQTPALPAKTSSYQSWATHLEASATAEQRQQELDGWLDRLQGPVQELPRDNPDGGLLNKHGATLDIRLDAERTERLLKQAPAAYRTQVNDLLLTALARVLCRWSGNESVLVQMEGHGREDLFDDIDLTRTVGWFTSLYPVKLTPAAELPASLKAVKEQLRGVPDKGLGYGLLRYLGTPQTRQALAALPQPRVTFNYLGQFDSQFDEKALFSPAGKGGGQAQADDAPLANWLSVEGQVYGGELSLRWGYSAEMYRAETIQRLADELVAELHAVIEHCTATQTFAVTPSDFPLARLSQAQLDNLPVVARDIEDIYPLSPMQQGMLFHTLYEQEGGDYINQMRVDVEGLDLERFRQSWQDTLNAHDILRTALLLDDGEPLQIVKQYVELPFEVRDLRNEADQHAALNILAEQERLRGFDLSQAPLLRLTLVELGGGRHHLLYTSHHILMDGWSNGQVLGEVLQRYAGQQPQHTAGHYRDYIAWLQSQDALACEVFWKDYLADLKEPTRLAQATRHTPEGDSQGQSDYTRVLEPKITQRLSELARQHKVTVNTLIQAAWLLLLQRYTRQDSVAFGATVSGRPVALKGVEQQVGLFINTLPVIAQPLPEQSVGEWLQKVQALNLALRDYEHTPLYDIQNWAGQGGDSLFDSLLVFENYPVAEILQNKSPAGLRFGEVINREQTNYPLTLVVGLGDTLSVQFVYSQQSFDRSRIEQLAGHFANLLQAMAGSGDVLVGELQMLGSEERQLVVEEWNRTEVAYPTEQCIHQLIEQQVARAPDATALVFGEQSLSYVELNQRANRLAHKLREQGVGPDVLVGLAVERSLEMVVGLLAILKAGGAYVPLDPEYPQDRLAYLMQDSGISLLLTQSHLKAQLPVPEQVQVLSLDEMASGLVNYSDENPGNLVHPDNLAYVIYTSGSTGKPKGTLLPHHNVMRLFQATDDWFRFDAQDVWTVFHSYAFDFSVWELYGALLYGGKAVIVAKDVARSPESFHALLRQERVTVLNQTPSAFKHLIPVACDSDADLTLRYVVFGGEALDVGSLAPWFERFGDQQPQLINMYGITETTVHVTYRPLSAADLQQASASPIGEVIPDLSWYLLDAQLSPVAHGVHGELHIGRAGLARGYHNRPALTAERFIPNPFDSSSQGGSRLYRSGDLGRSHAGGVVEYAGRIDHQVKIRGFRIELGEIEARVKEHTGVREAVVLDIDGPVGKQLVAYLVPVAELADEQQQPALRDSLREELKAVMPDYMVPAHFVFLESLPLTGNGKLDRKALPKPDASQQQAYVAPQSELEQHIAAIWADVLKIEKVGLVDNFFELGGDSIISIQVVSRARQTGIHFTPKQLFQHQTVQALAQVAARGESQALKIDQGLVTGEAILLPIHHWFFDSAVPDPHHWNQAILLKPGQTLDGARLQQALQSLVVHHDALRLVFTEGQEGNWIASYREPGETAAVLWQAEVPDEQALEALCEEAQRSLNLQEGPLLRAGLASLADGSQRLLLAIHHLAVDGVSWRILLEDLQAAYGQLMAGELVKLPAKTSSTQAWGEHLQAYARGEALQQELGYWTAELADVTDDLPCNNSRGSLRLAHACHAQTRLNQQLTRQLLQDAPATYRTQVNDLLLTALARVIARWTGRDQVLIQLEGHGREELFESVDLTRTVGWFTSVYPVKLVPAQNLDESIKRIKEKLRAIPGKGIGFGALRYLGDTQARQTLAELPQPRITFNYLGQFDGSFTGQSGQAAFLTPAKESAGASQSVEAPLGNWLTLNGKVYDGELSLDWEFSREMFSEAVIKQLAQDYAAELQALIEHCVNTPAAGLTPSDVPLAGLSQVQLDSLPIPAVEVEDIYPLSPMQQGMLFHSLYEQNGSYINQMRVNVTGLKVESFRHAWQIVLNRHEVLRASFVTQFDQPLQVIRKQVELPFVSLDWCLQPDVAANLEIWADIDRQKGFDLLSEPLVRISVIRTGENQHHLIYTSHHILMDGWSNAQLLGEVLEVYAGVFADIQVGRYRNYIEWLQCQDKVQSETFWRSQVNELQEPTRLVQSIRQDKAELGTGYGNYYQVLEQSRTRKLAEFARQHWVTVNTLVQAAWLLLLQRYTGQETVSFGATVAGRPAELKGIERQLGLFINTLPVIASPKPEQRVTQWLKQVQTQNLTLREHEHTPLYEVQRWAGLGGEGLFDTLLVFENYPVSEALQKGAPGELCFGEVLIQEQTNYPLTLLVGLDDELSIHYSYDQAFFGKTAIQQVARNLDALLSSLTERSELCLGELSLLSAQEHQKIVLDWNQTVTEYPQNQCLPQLIETQVQRAPEAVAVVFGGQMLTYRQLNGRANQLAYKLRELGVGPDVLVGLAVERSLEMVVGLLAILKAGGAYVPLDPEYPQERLAYMLEHSGARLLLTQERLLEHLPVTGIGTWCLDRDWAQLADYSSANPGMVLHPEHTAYCIYTSGSTGKPKGVAVRHQALVNFLFSMARQPGLAAEDRVLALTSLSFDIAGLELYLPLLVGASVILLADRENQDPQALLRLIEQQGVTTVQATPSTWRMLLDAAGPDTLRHCRLLSGGEALAPDLASRMLERADHVWNLYGPTETTIWSGLHCLDRESPRPLLGKPIANTALHIVESGLSAAPIGVSGELLIGGDGLARGYLHRPDLTAERFVPDPFDTSEQGGGRLYRTGDLACYHVDGVIEYVSRIDHQVKIRGFRIELGEVEAKLLEHEAVREAVVIDVDGPAGKLLAAYLVPNTQSNEEQQTQLRNELRQQLKSSLPDYMVPAYLLWLDKLPLTPNGKLDRKALQKPDASQQQDVYVAPQTKLEQQVAAIWAQVLKIEQVGLTDSFFELGGHSLLATQVISRVRQALKIELSLRVLFDAPQLAEFVARVAEGTASQAPAFEKANRDQPLKLSFAQQRQWFLWQLEPHSAAYNMPIALRFKGALNQQALRNSFDALIARHETLRTTFRQDGEQAIQIIHSWLDLDLGQENLVGANETELQAQVEAEVAKPFDLELGPLLRVKLLRQAEDEHVLVVTMHHIVSDGWSMPVMVEELVSLYEGYCQGHEVNLPALPIQYADYAIWQRKWMDAGERERQLDYWKGHLGDEHPVLELPIDRPRPAVQSQVGAELHIELSNELVQTLKQLAQRQGVTLFTLLLASFQTLLRRYSGQAHIRVGVPIANRTRVETERLIGFFVNTQVLQAEFVPDMTFSDLLKQLQQTTLDAQAHQDLPFEQLVEALQPGRSLSNSPLFQVMYNHQTQVRGGKRTLPGLEVDVLVGEVHVSKFDLTLDTFEHEQGLGASLTYATALFDEPTIDRLAGHWVNILEAVVKTPHQRIGELPMLANAERQFILTQWDQTGQTYQSDRFVHQLIEDHACTTPDAVAVIFDEQKLTYGQLDAQANRLAHKLIELGVGPEVRVAIAMRRSAEIMVAFLAVLKAGGAYVPLDIAYPQDRLLYMMNDCAATLVLTQSDLLGQLPIPDGLSPLTVDRTEDWHDYPSSAPVVALAEENLAYVIYTSGSTGLPKGVAVSHGPLVSHIRATGERYETNPSDCELHFMSFAFDGAHEGWMHPLINGARVLVRDDSLWLPERTYAEMHRHGVTLAVFPPVYLQQLAEHAERDGNPPPVRVYCFGGDAVPQASWDLAWRTLRPQYLFNGYGPTETVVTPLLWKARPADPCGAAYAPIGTLLGKRCGYVLDADLNLLPVGLAGELFLGGEGVARGYLERPALTAERFVPDPFGNGERVYRSGDLTRARPDGVVDYLGRVDHQVKVRGFRIELGEIEAQLLEQPSVREAVVLARDGVGGKQLVGYVVPMESAQEDLRDTLRSALKAVLPDYMVPAHVLILDSLPLTPNGKLDRKALPQPDASLMQQAYVAPGTELEQQIATIWADVLKLDRVGLNDNFFELGGHSLLATLVTSRVQSELGGNVPLDLLFKADALKDYVASTVPYLSLGSESDLNELHDFLSELETI